MSKKQSNELFVGFGYEVGPVRGLFMLCCVVEGLG